MEQLSSILEVVQTSMIEFLDTMARFHLILLHGIEFILHKFVMLRNNSLTFIDRPTTSYIRRYGSNEEMNYGARPGELFIHHENSEP